MLNKKLVIGFIIALIALIVVGFIALNFVPTHDVLDLNITGDQSNGSANSTINISEESITDAVLNDTAENLTEEVSDDASDVVNATNASSDEIDPGDVLKKQTFTVSENETGQNQGMEPGTYVMYYTGNDGPIKIEKVA